MSVKFFDIENRSTTYTSPEFDGLKPNYSVTTILSGTFNVDIKLQVTSAPAALDGWVDLEGSERASITSGPVVHDVSIGMHEFVRVVITRNSGSFDAVGYINNGY